jgi:hypothetical protein
MNVVHGGTIPGTNVCLDFRYRGPGENWTEKFPHVVGILHTNYFSYALDQPAALIRVSWNGMFSFVNWLVSIR